MNREQNKRIAQKAMDLLGVSVEQVNQNKLSSCVAEAVQRIENFCNRDDLPLQLEYAAARASTILYDSLNNESENAKPSGNITKYAEADASVEFDESNSKANASLTAFITDMQSELYRWRRISFD